ncbi:hypothetical protein ACSBR1_014246 [Camellia fascicularis]
MERAPECKSSSSVVVVVGAASAFSSATSTSLMDSIESRSVFQDEDKSGIEDEEDDEDLTPRIGMDSDDDDNSEQRLIWQALGSIPLMSKHLRSSEHNGTTLSEGIGLG